MAFKLSGGLGSGGSNFGFGYDDPFDSFGSQFQDYFKEEDDFLRDTKSITRKRTEAKSAARHKLSAAIPYLIGVLTADKKSDITKLLSSYSGVIQDTKAREDALKQQEADRDWREKMERERRSEAQMENQLNRLHDVDMRLLDINARREDSETQHARDLSKIYLGDKLENIRAKRDFGWQRTLQEDRERAADERQRASHAFSSEMAMRNRMDNQTQYFFENGIPFEQSRRIGRAIATDNWNILEEADFAAIRLAQDNEKADTEFARKNNYARFIDAVNNMTTPTGEPARMGPNGLQIPERPLSYEEKKVLMGGEGPLLEMFQKIYSPTPDNETPTTDGRTVEGSKADINYVEGVGESRKRGFQAITEKLNDHYTSGSDALIRTAEQNADQLAETLVQQYGSSKQDLAKIKGIVDGMGLHPNLVTRIIKRVEEIEIENQTSMDTIFNSLPPGIGIGRGRPF